MTVETENAVCYIMDTCCRQLTAEDRLQADRRIVRLAAQAALRRSRRKESPEEPSSGD